MDPADLPAPRPKTPVLKQVMGDRRMTIQTLALKTGDSIPDLSKVISGRSLPYKPQLHRIALAIGWPLDRALELLDPLVPQATTAQDQA